LSHIPNILFQNKRRKITKGELANLGSCEKTVVRMVVVAAVVEGNSLQNKLTMTAERC